jgi:hypothetical protein
MSMSPQEKREFDEMKTKLDALSRVLDVDFIENAKRRIALPVLGDSIQKDTVGGTSGTTKFVNEGGASTYDVAKAFTGTVTIKTADGNTYKLGYY